MQDALTFTRNRLLFAAAAGAIAASLSACGGGSGSGAEPLALDACSPVDGSMDIDRDTTITALFDQPVALGMGSVTLTVDDGDPQPISSEVNDTMLLVSPPGTGDVALWPPAANVELTFSGFQSADGGELEAPVTCSYTTIDDEAPRPETFIPPRDTCISARIDALRIVFNEPMNTDPTIGEYDEVAPFPEVSFFVPRSEAVWEVAPEDPEDAAPRVLVIPRLERSLLAYNQNYQINYRDFVDLAGNVIENGQFAYRFCVGEDNESPRVAEITPAYLLTEDPSGRLTDGAENVDPQATDEICITFDEDMNVGQTQARLVIDGEDSEPVFGTWDDLERTICFDLSLGNGATLLRTNAEHRLILGRLQDQAGNFISNDPILIDNSLDFTTGLDENPPAVVMSTPPEGTLEADFANLPELVLVFNEPIVEEAVGTLTLDVDDGTDTITFEPGVGYTWDDDSVTLTIDLTTVEGFALDPTTPYAIDLSTITDESGNTVDPESLGGDTSFDFTTRQPTGELCSEAVRMRDGDTDIGGGRVGVEWTIDEGSADENNGGTAGCDENPGNDLVFEYVKTSPSVAEDPVNGRYMTVQLVADDRGDAMNVQIFSDACDPEAEGNDDIACYATRSRWDVVRDAPAGTYYIWVAAAGGGMPAATLTVFDFEAVNEGDTCFDPYDDDSAIYTAPSGDNGARWNIPGGAVPGADHTESNVGGFTCGRGFGAHGVDAVIEFEKASDASFLTVNVQTSGAGADRIRVELIDNCDPTQATGAAFCTRNEDRNDLVSFEGGTFLPAGTYYLWVAANSPQVGGRDPDRVPFPETEVEIIETPLNPGEGCAVARVVGSPGTVTMLRDSDVTVDTPTCFDQGVAVNWWKYEAVNGGVAFAPNANSRVVLADATDGTELLCEPNSSAAAVGRIVEPGDELCVGIPVDSDATSFAVRDVAYSGIEGTTSDLGITFPASANITVDYFLTNDGSDLFLGYFDSAAGDARVAQFAKTGSVTATIYDAMDGVDLGTVGRGGVVANGALFSFDDRSSATSDKLYRIYDGTTFEATQWDTGSAAYPDDLTVRGLSTDGSSLFFATNQRGTTNPTTFYSRTASSSGPVTNEGTNSEVFKVTGIAADDTYYYVAGNLLSGDRSGIYRIARSDVGGTVEALTPTLPFSSNSATSLALDDLTNPQYLYFGVDDPDGIHVIDDPDGPNPTYLGEVVERNDGDFVFTYDRDEDVIYMYDTTSGDDAILEVQ